MMCIELDDVFKYDADFDCRQTFKFYFGDYSSKIASKYYDCKDIQQQVCCRCESAHAIFNSSHASNRNIKFQISLSIPKRISKRSSSDSWSLWSSRNDGSSSSSNWSSSRNDGSSSWNRWSSSWNDWSSSWNKWSPWSYEREESEEEESGAGSSVPWVLIPGVVVFFCLSCYVWCGYRNAGNRESAPNERTECSAVPQSQTVNSELPTHLSTTTPNLNSPPTVESSTHNGGVNALPSNATDEVNSEDGPPPSYESLFGDNKT